MSFLVIADLEMLVCDKTHLKAYDDIEFLERLITITEDCEMWVEENAGHWLFSQELFNTLWDAYPWNSPLHENTDLYTIFSTWIAKIDRIDVIYGKSHSFDLVPNLHATYASRDYPETDRSWRGTLSSHQKISVKQTLVFSFAGKADQVALIETTNQLPLQKFDVVKNENERLAIVMRYDPWLRYGLPKTGEVPYIPSDLTATDFPKVFYKPRNSNGFKDNIGRIWVEDEEGGQKHWDVQDKLSGLDKYIKVTPDGRRLH